MQLIVGIPANLLKHRAFRAGAAAKGTTARNEILLQPPGLDMDGMSKRKKRKFSFETL